MAQDAAFLGPGPVGAHVEHAEGFAAAVEAVGPPPGRALDLGSGGGIPGLPLAMRWPDCAWVLLDARARRAEFLRATVTALAWVGRVSVCDERAEQAGHTTLRASFDLVVARAFGAPPVVAECAAPFLRVGGILVVSEPPQADTQRWPDGPLAELGLAAERLVPGPPRFQVLRQVEPCPGRFARRVGVPERRPLW